MTSYGPDAAFWLLIFLPITGPLAFFTIRRFHRRGGALSLVLAAVAVILAAIGLARAAIFAGSILSEAFRPVLRDLYRL